MRVRIHEGPQTLVSEVSFPGAPDPGKLAQLVSVRKGRPLNSLEVENSRQAIQSALGKEGRAFARVEDKEIFVNRDHTEAVVSFEVSAGPKVKVGRILVQGLSRTAESVVRSALSVQEGGLLDPELVAQSQRNLIRLGIFRSATVRMNAPEVPEESKDLYVVAEERATQDVGLSFGYSMLDGPRATLEYTKVNLLGRALQFQGLARINYVWLSYQRLADPAAQGAPWSTDAFGFHTDLALRYPRILSLLPAEVGLRLDLIAERLVRPAYNFVRGAALVGADLAFFHGFAVSITYDIEGDNIQQIPGVPTVGLPLSDIERLRFPEGTVFLHSIGPSVSFDLRDDRANPHKGILLGASGEFVQSLGGSAYSLFVKASGQVSAYVPLWRRFVLALSVKAGKVFPLNAQSVTIEPKLFFMGGAGTMRGFPDDGMVPEDDRNRLRAEVGACNALLNKTGCSANAVTVLEGGMLVSTGGSLFTLGRAELRFPLTASVDGALFLDAGNLWDDPSKYDALKLRYAAGAGVRVVTPIGPAALDVGFNLAPDHVLNEAIFEPHFSIGLF